MSKAQGDGFRSWTKRELAQHSKRLGEKLVGMEAETRKWYTFGEYAILATHKHIVENPTHGSNRAWGKWDGWVVTGEAYRVAMYDLADLRDMGDGTYDIDGLPVLHRYMTTHDDPTAKDKMNEFFMTCRGYALEG